MRKTSENDKLRLQHMLVEAKTARQIVEDKPGNPWTMISSPNTLWRAQSRSFAKLHATSLPSFNPRIPE